MFSYFSTRWILLHLRTAKECYLAAEKNSRARAQAKASLQLYSARAYMTRASTRYVIFPLCTCFYSENVFLHAQAWSRIVHSIIPNAAVLTKHLTTFAEVCSATEVILFERTTFLVIATSNLQPPQQSVSAIASSHKSPSVTSSQLLYATNGSGSELTAPNAAESLHALNGKRYERTSELIKALKYSCMRLREEFGSLEMELPECTAVLTEMTRNTYVLVIAHDPTIGARI
jgi:Ras-related GTP-binding protein A/B